MRDDFALLGLELPANEKEESDDVIEVWESNWQIVELFLALETQWRVAVVGGGLSAARAVWLGLDYAAVDAVIRRFGFADTDREVLADLRVMEEAALMAQDGGQ